MGPSRGKRARRRAATRVLVAAVGFGIPLLTLLPGRTVSAEGRPESFNLGVVDTVAEARVCGPLSPPPRTPCPEIPANTPQLPASGELSIPGFGPRAVAGDTRGTIYYSGALVAEVRKTDPSRDTTRVPARVIRPTSLAAGPPGILYVLDNGANRVQILNLRKKSVRLNGVTVPANSARTVAGNGKIGRKGDGGPAAKAQISSQGGIALDSKGNLLIADAGNQRIRRVDRRGIIRTLVAPATRDKSAECCVAPIDVVADRSGNLYVLDAGRVWFINLSKRTVTTRGHTIAPRASQLLAGQGPDFGVEGGPATGVRFGLASALAMDGLTGDLFVADAAESVVRKIDVSGNISTVAGTGQHGFNGDGRRGQLAVLNAPSDLAIDRCGNLLIADLKNDRIRRLNLVASCRPRTVPIGP